MLSTCIKKSSCLLVGHVITFLLFFGHNSGEVSVVKLSKSCGLNLIEGMDYCKIDKEDVNCYVEKALEFRKNANQSLPLWVQVCFFDLPETFTTHLGKYQCKVMINLGPVKCIVVDNKTSIDGLRDFERNCTFGLFWLTMITFPKDYYRNLLLGDGKCMKSYEDIWTQTDTLYASQRYIYKRDVGFGRISDWKKINKFQPSVWTVTTISLLTAGLIGICIGVVYAVIVMKRTLKKDNQSAGVMLSQLAAIMELKELQVAKTSEDVVEVVDVLPEVPVVDADG